jgi:GNAT superfamily N-acetyltransferase
MSSSPASALNVEIATMLRGELDTVAQWAAQECWNPGLRDAPCNYAADPQGFVIAKVDGKPVGSISAVRYESGYGFMGFYIVLPEFRGRGIGRLLWSEALRRLEGRVVGLDGVMAMVPCYAKSGFVTHHINTRHRFKAAPHALAPTVKRLSSLPLAKVLEYDRRHHPAARAAFLDQWVRIPGSHGFVSVTDARVNGYGVIRPSQNGWRIGPLFADSAAVAGSLLEALCGSVNAGDDIFMDVPGCNEAACALAEARGVEKLFQTARMYRGVMPALNWNGVFGVSSVELG